MPKLGFYDPLDNNELTLDYIFKNASDEELEAIVHSIAGRLWKQILLNPTEIDMPTDKELHILAKGLRKPQ